MTNQETLIKNLLDGGAVRWTKYGKDRIYLRNFLKENSGLEIERYNSGNISSAKLNGEKISNSMAGRILGIMEVSYYDIQKDTFFTGETRQDEVRPIIMAAIEKVMK